MRLSSRGDLKVAGKLPAFDEVLFYRLIHSPRTTLLNAMRYLATNSDGESGEVYALSIRTLADALAKLGATGSEPDEEGD